MPNWKNPFETAGTGGTGAGRVAPPSGAASWSNPFEPADTGGNGLNPDGSVMGSKSEEQIRMEGSGYASVGSALQKAQGYAAGRFLTGALTLGGKVLQPLAAPQQLVFGAMKSIGDLAHGDPAQSYADLKQAAQTALSFATYGGYQAGQGKKDIRDNALLGYDLLKEAGANDWFAKWGGLGMDFFIDVPVLGKAAKFAKLDKLGGIGDKFENVFQNGTDLQKFAAHIAAAPMSNAPIPHLIQAIPQGNIGNLAGREQMARNIAELIERDRFSATKQNLSSPVGVSLSESLIAPSGRVQGLPAINLQELRTTGARGGVGLPDAYKDLEARARQVKANISMRLMAAGKDVSEATKGMSLDQKAQYEKIMGRLVDHKGPADQMDWRGELQTFAQALPDPTGFLAKADKALRHSTQADVFAAQNLHAVNLMTPGSLAAYQSGDRGHLRRMFSMWENPGQHLERIRKNTTAESLTVDPAKLASFFDNAAGMSGKRGPGIGAQMAADFRAAYSSGTPEAPLVSTLQKHNFTDAETLAVLKDLGGEFARKAGLKYVPDNMDLYKALRKYSDESQQGFGGAGGIVGGSSAKPITQRTELADYQLEGLGEITDHMKRVERQGQVVGKIVSTRMITQGYHDLMAKDGVILDSIPHSMTDTSGWRTVNAEQAKAFGLPQLEGKMIPALFHRRLVDTTTIKEPTVQRAIWDWTAAAWRRSKLANPASIARNMASGYIAAQQFGIGQRELFQGAKDYVQLVTGAKRGDGVFDTAHKVNGISMSELADHGEFIHASMMHNEVTGPMKALTEQVANEAGSPFQQHVAKTAAWMDAVSSGEKGKLAQGALLGAGLAGDALGLGTGPVTKFLSDKYGMVDAHMKGAIFMALRRKGMTAEEAARHADEALFNYENVPYIVNGLRKLGLAGLPFASYQVLATGRFFKNMYERPYLTARNYRVANSVSADQTKDEKANEYYASPDYIKNALWLRVGDRPDASGKRAPQYVNFSGFLPESPVWDMANSDNVTNFEPPASQLWRTLLTGSGYQGRPTYNGGKDFSTTLSVNPEEAIRGALKSIWQFGASPWGPGQPMTERIVKAIAAQTVPESELPKPVAQALLKFYAQGPLAMGYKSGPEAVQRAGGSAPQATVDALLRELGVSLQTIQPDYSQAGTGQSNLIGDISDLSTLDKMRTSEMRDATTSEERRKIALKYADLKQKIALKARQQTGAHRAVRQP